MDSNNPHEMKQMCLLGGLCRCVYLVVYVDDIVITGNDQEKISQLKEHLFSHFQTKDLEKLKYFLGIEVAQSKDGIIISQRKYVLCRSKLHDDESS